MNRDFCSSKPSFHGSVIQSNPPKHHGGHELGGFQCDIDEHCTVPCFFLEIEGNWVNFVVWAEELIEFVVFVCCFCSGDVDKKEVVGWMERN